MVPSTCSRTSVGKRKQCEKYRQGGKHTYAVVPSAWEVLSGELELAVPHKLDQLLLKPASERDNRVGLLPVELISRSLHETKIKKVLSWGIVDRRGILTLFKYRALGLCPQ